MREEKQMLSEAGALNLLDNKKLGGDWEEIDSPYRAQRKIRTIIVVLIVTFIFAFVILLRVPLTSPLAKTAGMIMFGACSFIFLTITCHRIFDVCPNCRHAVYHFCGSKNGKKVIFSVCPRCENIVRKQEESLGAG